MELFKEILLTGFLAVLMSFIVAKIVSFVLSTDESPKHAVAEVNDLPETTLKGDEQRIPLICNKMEVQATTIAEVTVPLEVQADEEAKEFRSEVKHISETEVAECNEVSASSANIMTVGEQSDAGSEVGEMEIEDEWEGIERSETEKLFMRAVRLVESGEKAGVSDEEGLQLELYGLYKVATEGSCHEQPPFSLKFTARAKWNAWHKLGNMSPEAAMGQYVAIVSARVSGWIDDKATTHCKASTSGVTSGSSAVDLTNDLSDDSCITSERNDVSEEIVDVAVNQILEIQVKE